MLNYKLKIGLVPNVRDLGNFDTRKGIFEPAKGVENKDKVFSHIKSKFADENTEFTTLNGLTSLVFCTKTAMFGEFTTRHPENKNAEPLWHCGPFPYSMKKEGVTARLPGSKPSFRAKDGQYTIARFQGDRGNYTLLGGEYHTTEGPHTFGTYMWAEFNNLSRIEKKLINGPYIHHMAELYGCHADVLEEFCKYIPGLTYDPIEG